VTEKLKTGMDGCAYRHLISCCTINVRSEVMVTLYSKIELLNCVLSFSLFSVPLVTDDDKKKKKKKKK
jgi:hypothetical protein